MQFICDRNLNGYPWVIIDNMSQIVINDESDNGYDIDTVFVHSCLRLLQILSMK